MSADERAPALADLTRLAARVRDLLLGVVTEQSRLATPKLFRRLLFAWLFLHTALLLPHHREIWAPGAFVQRYPFAPGDAVEWLLTLSRHPLLEAHYLWFIYGQLLVLGLGLLGVWPRLMVVLAYLLTMNINSLAGVILDGGNNLAQLVLFFLLFVNTSGRPLGWRRWPTLRAFLVGASNLGFKIIQLQIVVVYLCTAIFKLNGQLWSNGMALYYILQADSYSHPRLHQMIIDWPALSLVGSYITLAFQALFVTLIWSRRARPLLLTVGIALHLSISFGMGLFTFGLVMCVMYAAFFEEQTCQRILRIGGRARLGVLPTPDAPALQRLLTALRALDRRDALVTLDQASFEARAGAPPPAEPLCALDLESGEVYRGPAALRELLVRPILSAPIAPLTLVMWYVGALNWALRRLVRAA